MHAFFAALGHLLWHSLLGLVGGWMGTTLLALGVGLINYYVAPWIDAKLHGDQSVKPRLTGSIIAAAGSWFLLFSVSVIYTVYVDHVKLVSENQSLTTQNFAKQRDIEQFKTKLSEVCFAPARHFTQEQKKLVYLALRDLAEKTPQAHKRLFIGSVRGDMEAQRFIQFSLSPAFTNAGWKIVNTFDRPMRRKDTDVVYPGSQQGLNISYTAEQGTAQYKWQNELTYGIIGAFHQAEIEVYEGVVMKEDPLKNTNALVIWVGPKPMTSEYQY